VGKGTRFTVLLPRATAKALQPTSPRADAPLEPIRFETVLVCDDDAAVRQLLVDLLRIRAYEVLEARDGRHAIEIAEAHAGDIELLITDLIMPELGGVELAARLRARHPRMRVLYVSGYTDDSQLLSGATEEGTAFLAKPFLPGDLVLAVHGLLLSTGPESQSAHAFRRTLATPA
jgi:CheY-like chemotaxis protein